MDVTATRPVDPYACAATISDDRNSVVELARARMRPASPSLPLR